MSIHRWDAARDNNEPAIVAAFKAAQCVVWPISGAAIPDLLVGIQGRWIVVEVKTPTGRLTGPQEAFFDIARLRHLPAYVCRTVDDVARILENNNAKTTA